MTRVAFVLYCPLALGSKAVRAMMLSMVAVLPAPVPSAHIPPVSCPSRMEGARVKLSLSVSTNHLSVTCRFPAYEMVYGILDSRVMIHFTVCSGGGKGVLLVP